jgi:hypothetical protein
VKLREIPCPAFGDGHPGYQPGDCWFARELTHAEAAAAANDVSPQMHRVTACRWSWWSDRIRLLDDSDIAPEHAARHPLIVVLPNGAPFVTTCPVRAGSAVREWHQRMAEWARAAPGRTWSKAWREVPGPTFSSGWAISGEGIALSLSPSIHYDPGGTREWHGYLTNGELVG